ncbi:hypothetical protein ACO0SA_003362 [Hanseniaspora valbyensis]
MSDPRYNPTNLKNTNFFKPLKLSNKITLQHRGVLAPSTRFRADKEHVPNLSTDYAETDDWKKFISESSNKTGDKKRGLVEEYYFQRSQKPGTLLITEATIISPKAGGYDYVPGIYNEAQVKNWSKIADAVHENGSYIFVQLWSLGRAADPAVLKIDGFPYVSSSDKYILKGDYMETRKKSLESGNKLRPVTLEEIEQFKKDYISATRNSFEAGIDGVELHSANGFLLNQFMDKVANQRNDKYGAQNFENRSRLLLEVFDELVEEFGGDRIALRLFPFGSWGDMCGSDDVSDTISFYTYLYKEFEKRKLNGKGPVYISLIEPRDDAVSPEPEMKFSNEFIFDYFSGVVIRTGSILLDNEYIKKIINQNDRTLIAFGRYFISNPDLIERLENEWPINKYDRSSFYTPGYKGYIDYPYYKK